MSVVGGENAVDTLNGWFKELYASEEQKLVPEAAWIVKNIPFNKSEAGLGNLYHQPVVLTQEQGFTYAGPAAGAFALNSPVSAILKDAQVQGAQIMLRSQIDYESLARAANTKASFGDASKLLVENMLEAMSKRLELMFIYGRSPGGVGVLGGSHTAATFQLSTASWAPGLWAGMEGAVVHVLSVTGTYPSYTVGTRRNGVSGTIVVSVNFATRTITVTAASLTAAADGDIVVLFGTWSSASGGTALTSGVITFLEALGLDGMIQQASGTLFNIDIGTYKIFAGNNPAAVSALSVTNLLSGLLPAIGKGLMEDVVCLCSNSAYQGLVSPVVDPVALGGSSNSKVGLHMNKNQSEDLRLGAKNITIVGQQGNITVQPHLFLKDKDIFIFPKKRLMKVGATDVTFNTPGNKGGEFFLHLPSNAGYELRSYCNMGLFSPTVGRLTKMTLS